MAYQYRGTNRDLDEPIEITPAPKPKPVSAPVTPGTRCGTRMGYKDHREHNEEACGPCKEAIAAYSRAYRARVRSGQVVVMKNFTPERCGTYSGYSAHKRHNLEPCVACKVAHADYMHAYRAARKAA